MCPKPTLDSKSLPIKAAEVMYLTIEKKWLLRGALLKLLPCGE